MAINIQIEVQHDTREAWLQAFTRLARPKFEEVGAPLPERVQTSIGFPSAGGRSKVIGECWAAQASKGGTCEIFLRPSLQASVAGIAGVLVHELVHAAVGHEAKHGKLFAKPARALGLEGKLTATTVGEEFFAWAQPLLDHIGPFPGHELEGALAGGRKTQTTRMVKVECDDCGFAFRASQTQIDRITDHTCIACVDGTLQTKG